MPFRESKEEYQEIIFYVSILQCSPFSYPLLSYSGHLFRMNLLDLVVQHLDILA